MSLPFKAKSTGLQLKTAFIPYKWQNDVLCYVPQNTKVTD